jgi:hypothetical protein
LEGKVFVGFLALVLRSYMLRVLCGGGVIKGLTFEKVLLELDKIRVVTFVDQTVVFTPLTKLQRAILEVFKVPLETLTTQSTYS